MLKGFLKISFVVLAIGFLCMPAWGSDNAAPDPGLTVLLAHNGYGPGDGTGNDGDGPSDGTGNGAESAGKGNGGSGDNGGNGPGDGTGNDGDGPADGTGYGPGDYS